jgi:non-specific serine/threonine protein kinase
VRVHLIDKRVLLVLDNFEHLLGAAPFATRLLSTAPSVKVLATSREPLRLRGSESSLWPHSPYPIQSARLISEDLGDASL